MLMVKTIIHQLSLTGIGGVQQSFLPYFKKALKESKFNHKIYGMHKIDDFFYNEIKKYYINMNDSFFYKMKFIYLLYSKNYIIHFYNNLGSKRIKKLLQIFPSTNIIFHERGTAWNAKNDLKEIYKFNASKAKVILANSNASKIMLNQKFGISNEKIKVVYNGFLDENKEFICNKMRYSNSFSIGYIGRLDTPKGVHILVKAAKKMKNCDFFIAGDGAWKDLLIKLADGYKNIRFVGRIKEPLEFMSKMDIIVVPSIREPLGNTIIEAGFCKKAVIASNIDGIPEIIENQKSGILLNPKNSISIKNLPKNAVPFPDVVVDSVKKRLTDPKEIDVDELCNAIETLKNDNEQREKFGKNLYKTVKERFSLDIYFNNLEEIYRDIL